MVGIPNLLQTNTATPFQTNLPDIEACAVTTACGQAPAAPILFTTYPSGIFDEVEAAVPGIRGLSFVDDIGWWADGENDEAVAKKLSKDPGGMLVSTVGGCPITQQATQLAARRTGQVILTM